MKFDFKYVMLVLALALAGCAAYFSIWGLSQLFAGASTAVIIMASVLEVCKIVTTKALHTYWTRLNKTLRVYLSISIVVLMLITSAGIYGFLSNAYQSTANRLEIHEGELGVLGTKKTAFEKTIADNQKNVDFKTKRIDQLSNLRAIQETRIDNATSNTVRNAARNDIKNADSEIQKLTTEIDGLNSKNVVLNDSVNVYNTKALTLKSGSSVAAEVGPLKYISELTGVPMPKVVNYLILMLIFVFDPLAIALVLATNRVFELGGEIKKKDEGVNEGANEINEGANEKSDEIIDGPSEEAKEEPKEEAKAEAKPKLALEELKEIKDRERGFSVKIPEAKTTNTIQRIGTNKITKNGDNDKVYFKR